LPKELRVHGVSGTPPTELLFTDPVTYDQGWDLAKVYERSRDDWDVKAYHWGSLTSKSSLTAFWILLTPFAMANAAGWMSESPNVWSRAWIRVAGLSLTGIFFVQLANMTFDVPLNTGLAPTAVKWVFVTAALALVFGLGWLSTQSSFKPLTARERLRHLFSPTFASMNPLLKEPEWDDPAGGCTVVGTRMWSVHSIVHRLRRIHLTFGMAMLTLVIGRAVEVPALQTAAVTLAGVMLVTLALTTGPMARYRPVLALTAISTLVGVGLLLWALFSLAGSDLGPRVDVSDDLTYEVALVLGVAAGLGLAGELVTSRLRRGWVPLGLLAVATLIGGTFGLTGSMLVETYLSESATTTETFDGGAASVTVGMLGLAVVAALTFAIATFFPKKGNDGSRMRRGILRARLILGVAGLYGAAFGAVAAMLSCQGAVPGCSHRNIAMPDWVVEDPENISVLLGIPFDPASLLGWAKIVMVAVPAVFIVRSIVGGLLNGQDARRQVGILWDLGSFWPRWFHPLAPPAYGPYAVTRLQTILSEEKPEVLSAHSQGSLIAAVALCLADEDDRPGLFVTYGSQLGDLYPSLFPGVGIAELITATSRQVDGRWINLWRGSDAVGGQVVSDLGSRNWEVTTGSGHSRYELTPEFCSARLAEVSGDLDRPGDPDLGNCWHLRR
jgi:hypothetical protein